jgi:hypothetical protein
MALFSIPVALGIEKWPKRQIALSLKRERFRESGANFQFCEGQDRD